MTKLRSKLGLIQFSFVSDFLLSEGLHHPRGLIAARTKCEQVASKLERDIFRIESKLLFVSIFALHRNDTSANYTRQI